MIVMLFFGGWLGPVLPPRLWFMLRPLVFVALLHPGAGVACPGRATTSSWRFGWKVMLPLCTCCNLLVTALDDLPFRWLAD